MDKCSYLFVNSVIFLYTSTYLFSYQIVFGKSLFQTFPNTRWYFVILKKTWPLIYCAWICTMNSSNQSCALLLLIVFLLDNNFVRIVVIRFFTFVQLLFRNKSNKHLLCPRFLVNFILFLSVMFGRVSRICTKL